MYDDYFASPQSRMRIGTSFTPSREDRFSEIDQSSPDNTSIYNSDGVLAFSTGAFAPGVTVEQAMYRMWAIDGGFQKRGFSVNGQYYFRWVNDFVADGPLPLASTFDHGFELSTGQFVPKTLVCCTPAVQRCSDNLAAPMSMPAAPSGTSCRPNVYGSPAS
jgi:hypothetical protein